MVLISEKGFYIILPLFALTCATLNGKEPHNNHSTTIATATDVAPLAAQQAIHCVNGECNICPSMNNYMDEILCICTAGCPFIVGCRMDYNEMPGCRRRHEAIDECTNRSSCRITNKLNQTIGLQVFVDNGTLSTLPSETMAPTVGDHVTAASPNVVTDEQGLSNVKVIIAVITTVAVVVILGAVMVYFVRRTNAKKNKGNPASASFGQSAQAVSPADKDPVQSTKPLLASNETCDTL